MSKTKHLILDVEATAPTPMSGVMTEFALAHLESESTFYAHLYRAHPHPDIPALPVVEMVGEDPREDPWFAIDGKDRAPSGGGFSLIVTALSDWVASLGAGRPVLVSDNPGFDVAWFNCWTDSVVGAVLFGHSSRRIGDFAAGQVDRWSDQSSWKRLRSTAHTHHPLDDAVGNREALRTLLAP